MNWVTTPYGSRRSTCKLLPPFFVLSCATGFASGGATAAPDCAICLDTFKNPQTLKCGHTFCTDCAREALKRRNTCPVCKQPQGVVKGTQPPGKMEVYHERHLTLPGYPGNDGLLLKKKKDYKQHCALIRYLLCLLYSKRYGLKSRRS